MPKGDRSTINYEGVNYYDRLINELLSKSIEPIICMHHFDMPQSLQEMGGWLNDKIIDYFLVYADFLFEHFGNRVSETNIILHVICTIVGLQIALHVNFIVLLTNT